MKPNQGARSHQDLTFVPDSDVRSVGVSRALQAPTALPSCE